MRNDIVTVRNLPKKSAMKPQIYRQKVVGSLKLIMMFAALDGETWSSVFTYLTRHRVIPSVAMGSPRSIDVPTMKGTSLHVPLLSFLFLSGRKIDIRRFSRRRHFFVDCRRCQWATGASPTSVSTWSTMLRNRERHLELLVVPSKFSSRNSSY